MRFSKASILRRFFLQVCYLPALEHCHPSYFFYRDWDASPPLTGIRVYEHSRWRQGSCNAMQLHPATPDMAALTGPLTVCSRFISLGQSTCCRFALRMVSIPSMIPYGMRRVIMCCATLHLKRFGCRWISLSSSRIVACTGMLSPPTLRNRALLLCGPLDDLPLTSFLCSLGCSVGRLPEDQVKFVRVGFLVLALALAMHSVSFF